jgi:hypothetical protein
MECIPRMVFQRVSEYSGGLWAILDEWSLALIGNAAEQKIRDEVGNLDPRHFRQEI